MGCRVAKFEGEDVWVVYQSVTDAVFDPMFYTELAARLYARHWCMVGLGHKDWGRQYDTGAEVSAFILALYGEDPENHPDYFNVLAAVECDRHDTMRDLWLVFAEWRKDRSLRPDFKLVESDY